MPLTTELNQTALFLSNLFARLNEEKITYCVLRNYETLPERVGNDVDIWVKESDCEGFYEIVKNLSVALDYTLDYTPRLTLLGEGDYFLIKNNKALCIVHIDCWTYIHWKGIPYIKQSTLENSLQWYKKGFYVLDSGIAAGIMLLKELLQHGKVKEKYKDTIKEIANDNSELFLASFSNYFGDKYSTILHKMAKDGRWEDLEQKTIKLRTVLFVRSFLHPFSQGKWWLRYLRAQFRRFFLNPRGLFIVLIGPDGSGKSTTANNLINSEIKRLFQKKLYFHGHFHFLPELKKIAAFLKRNRKKINRNNQSLEGNSKTISNAWIATPSARNDGGRTSGESHNEHQEPLGFFRSMIYPIYYGFNYFLGHFFLWKEKARGGLIVFDRYFYDYMIQNLYAKCPRWLLNLIAKIIPKPDILIYLKNDPEVVYSRKPELSIEEIKGQSKICEQITNRFNNSFVVETSLSPDKVVGRIQGIIINRIRER